MKKTVSYLGISLALAFFIAVPVSADFYKWVDANGVTHYTQIPPPPAQAKNVEKLEDVVVTRGMESYKDERPLQAEATPDSVEDAYAVGVKNEAHHANYCEERNTALRQLIANPLVLWKEGDSEERLLSADDRAGKIKQIQGDIKKSCSPILFPVDDRPPLLQ